MNSFRTDHEGISSIRVLITNLTGVIAELITQAIQQQPDIELLGTAKEWNQANALIGKATVVVIGSDETVSSEAYLELLNDYPQLKILMLKADSDEGIVYWRTVHCQQMQVISAQTLIESIRRIHSLPYTDMHQPLSFPERN